MEHAQRSTVIATSADLDAWLGDSESVEDWMSNRCELVDQVIDEAGSESCQLSVFMYAVSTSAHHVITLPYPFDVADLEHEADLAELFFEVTIEAAALDQYGDATLGDPSGDDDVTAAFADGVLGGAAVTDVVDALGGEWQSIDLEVRQGSTGGDIAAWFIPSDSRCVALGVGAVDLFVVPLHRDDKGYVVDEWPHPSVGLWWNGPWADGVPQTDPAETVEGLRAAIASVLGGQ